MNVVVLGLNHKTAPIEIRERLAFDAVQIEAALAKLKERYGQSEFAVLSTCNRVELYCASGQDVSVVAKGMAELLSDFHGVDLEEFRECLYVFEDAEAVRHLLMVASSLDSMVIGEAQIIGQVKELAPRFDMVNEGMRSQSEGARHISDAMIQLSEGARKTSESLGHFNEATEHLREAAFDLQAEIAQFKA